MNRIVVFAGTWVILLLLWAFSWWSAYLPLGRAHAFLPIGIAACQALLIAIVFMKLGHGPRLKWLFAGVGFYWLLIMMGLSAADYMTRSGWPTVQ